MSLILRDGRAAEARPAHRPNRVQCQRLVALRMRREGHTIRFIAEFFGVNRQTIYNWRRAIPPEAAKMAAFR